MGGRLRVGGLIVGLIGAGLTGYALFALLSSAGCLGAIDAACPSPTLSPTLALPAGIILATAGIFMGGGMLVFSALFMAIGLGALTVAALGLMPSMPSFGWFFGGMFFLGGLVPFFGGFALRRAGAAKQAMAEELMRSGVKGIGTIVDVGDTGITINNNPRIVIRMRIVPDDGSATVERSKTVTVSRVAIPQAGARYPAWFDRADPDKWMYATDMDSNAPAEAKDLFARAAAGAGPGGAGASQPEGGAVDELARLTGLWKEGALTDAEFADAKARLLPRIGQ